LDLKLLEGYSYVWSKLLPQQINKLTEVPNMKLLIHLLIHPLIYLYLDYWQLTSHSLANRGIMLSRMYQLSSIEIE